eukprot:scaffold240759_cov19-Tisochrysis_lutea.AAC.1
MQVLDVLECLSSRTTTAGSAADAAVGACMGGAAVGQGMWGSGMGLADTQGLESHAAWLACLGNWDGREHGELVACREDVKEGAGSGFEKELALAGAGTTGHEQQVWERSGLQGTRRPP